MNLNLKMLMVAAVVAAVTLPAAAAPAAQAAEAAPEGRRGIITIPWWKMIPGVIVNTPPGGGNDVIFVILKPGS